MDEFTSPRSYGAHPRLLEECVDDLVETSLRNRGESMMCRRGQMLFASSKKKQNRNEKKAKELSRIDCILFMLIIMH